MKDLSRIKQNEKGYYIEQLIYSKRYKNGKYLQKHYGQILICSICEELYFTPNHEIKKGYGQTCSRSCAMMGKNNPMHGIHQKGKFSPNWSGGKKKEHGYVLIWKPKHPYRDNRDYVFEHRLVMEKHLGRYLKPDEIVIHINNIPDDNRIDNLRLFKNWKERHSGKNSSVWKGGIGKEPYPFEFDKKLKEKIRKRDNYTCQHPGCKQKQNGKVFDTHHIDYDKNNLDLTNLITLCRKHNSKVNHNRKYWKKYFQNLIKKRLR